MIAVNEVLYGNGVSTVAYLGTILFFGMIFFVIILDLLYRRSRRRRELAEMQLEIQERTFQTISHEIHDNVGQVLSLARVQINVMSESGRMDEEMMLQVKDLIGRAMSDLRDLAKSLNTEQIMNLRLHETIQQECESISRSGIICATIAVEGVSRDIEGQKKLIVFRVVQEAIQNCIKHAHAATISISLLYDISGIRIMVIDDGKGFDVSRALECTLGSGIGNIRRRAALAKATCTIESTIGQGTTVRIFVPYG